jgi:octaprenyl-diphosphate synthase
MLLLLAAGALGHRGPDAHQLAAVVEFIHTATLLHDDVVDESTCAAAAGPPTRSGVTPPACWSAIPVLAQLPADGRAGTHAVMQILADTTNQIAEVSAAAAARAQPGHRRGAYLRVIERKTAVLFAAATRWAPCSPAPTRPPATPARVRPEPGYAFQIADDVLDYASDAQTLGKNQGDDLAEGKATLPLIHAIAHSDEATPRGCATPSSRATPARCRGAAAIHATAGLDYSRRRAGEYAAAAERALDGLADNDYTLAARLARYAVSRTTELHHRVRSACRGDPEVMRRAGPARETLAAHGIRRGPYFAAKRSRRSRTSSRRRVWRHVRCRRSLAGCGHRPREAMNSAAEIDELPVGAGGVHLLLERGDVLVGDAAIVGAVEHQHRVRTASSLAGSGVDRPPCRLTTPASSLPPRTSSSAVVPPKQKPARRSVLHRPVPCQPAP